MKATAVSAAGKVLLAGGYLILSREHTGLVLGLDARIYVLITDVPCHDDSAAISIQVQSPQFAGTQWTYTLTSWDQEDGVHLVQGENQNVINRTQNPFVETSLAYALTYVAAKGLNKPSSMRVTILADSDYYSPPEPGSSTVSPSGSRFVDFGVPLDAIRKTGLGSSAALVTALVAALFYHHKSSVHESLHAERTRERVHKLSQAAHCAAQGKIGSGFDVAAAVYGSCIYRRFSPAVLEQLGKLGSQGFRTRLVPLVDGPSSPWDYEIQKLSPGMPPGLRLILCDVDSGSETRGMVKSVTAWQGQNPEEASVLWRKLQGATDDMISDWRCHSTNSERSWENLRHTIQLSRSLVRELSLKSDVSVEPKSQTQLLDSCSQLSGIIGGVVPGAGGYDALAIVAEDLEGVTEDLRLHLRGQSPICIRDKEGLHYGTARVLNVKHESEGLRLEPTGPFSTWTS